MTKILDNFDLILDFLEFPNEDTFYYLQILQREGKFKHRQRYSTLLSRDKKLDIDEIKYLCRIFTARAYISVIPRSLRKFTLELSKEVIDRVAHNAFITSTLRLPDSVALSQQTICSKSSLWMFDVDDPNLKDIILEECIKSGIEVKLIVPSFSGCHIIVKPFNPKDFKYSSLIKKESNTIIFGYKS